MRPTGSSHKNITSLSGNRGAFSLGGGGVVLVVARFALQWLLGVDARQGGNLVIHNKFGEVLMVNHSASLFPPQTPSYPHFSFD